MRDALRAVRELKESLARFHAPVAIVGVGLRLPPAIDDLDGLWAALQRGEPVWRPGTPERVADSGVGGVAAWLDDVASFDHHAFRIAPEEARQIDPQIRLLLEAAGTALAQVTVADAEVVGTFAGLASSDWAQRTLHGQAPPHPQAGLGGFRAMASARLAHAFDLRGPAVTVDASCASGLVAVHEAVLALRAGTCDLALAGAASVILSPGYDRYFRSLGLISDEGVRPYDAGGRGYVRGEGAVVLLLQPLAEAERAGRPVLAVLEGTAIGCAGRTLGIGTPSARMHADVAMRALADADVTPGQVALLEGHGVGSPLADQLEATGLSQAYAGARQAPAGLGSVKQVFGHLEAVSGLLGLVSAALMRAKGRGLLATVGSPVDGLGADGPLVPRQAGPLTAEARLGVHVYGMSGHVAHVVVGPAPTPPTRSWPARAYRRERLWIDPPSRQARPAAAQEGDVEAWVLAELQAMVGPDPVLVPDRPLTWQGVDSLTLAALVARLQEVYGVDPNRFEQAPTWDVRRIAGVVRGAPTSPAPQADRSDGLAVAAAVALGALALAGLAWWALAV